MKTLYTLSAIFLFSLLSINVSAQNIYHNSKDHFSNDYKNNREHSFGKENNIYKNNSKAYRGNSNKNYSAYGERDFGYQRKPAPYFNKKFQYQHFDRERRY